MLLIGLWRLIPTLSALHAAQRPAPITARSPAVVKLGSDSFASSNDGAPSMPPHNIPLPFIDDPQASFALHINQWLSTGRSRYRVHSRLQPETHSPQSRRNNRRSIFSASLG